MESYQYPARIITAGSPVAILAGEQTLFCNHSAALQLNIPATAPGKIYLIIDISNNALVNNVTLSGVGCTINGGLTSVIATNRGLSLLVSDGTNYYKGTSIL